MSGSCATRGGGGKVPFFFEWMHHLLRVLDSTRCPDLISSLTKEIERNLTGRLLGKQVVRLGYYIRYEVTERFFDWNGAMHLACLKENAPKISLRHVGMGVNLQFLGRTPGCFVRRRPKGLRSDPNQCDAPLHLSMGTHPPIVAILEEQMTKVQGSGVAQTPQPMTIARLEQKLEIQNHTFQQGPDCPPDPTSPGGCKTKPAETGTIMPDSRLIVRRKIADTLYGEVLECDLLLPDDTEAHKTLTVAVKHISLDIASHVQVTCGTGRLLDDPFQELRVAQALMDLDGHPNILYPISQMVQDGELYLIYEYCAGGDLFQLLEANKFSSGLSESQALALMRQVLEGVRFLHSTVGVAHRDLSLENVLLDGEDNVCKIADFALSVDVNATPSDEQVGKDFYMAPEVVARERYDPVKADIWSLGIMWFILLTGSRLVPIASRSDKSFLALEKHGIEAVLENWGYTGRISHGTVDLLSRMLCVDPVKRIDLEEILTHSVFS